jgi:hypothetical protein
LLPQASRLLFFETPVTIRNAWAAAECGDGLSSLARIRGEDTARLFH